MSKSFLLSILRKLVAQQNQPGTNTQAVQLQKLQTLFPNVQTAGKATTKNGVKSSLTPTRRRRKRITFASCIPYLTHLTAIFCIIPAAWFNIVEFYHGTNLITSDSEAGDIARSNWLQVAAKAQETVIISSLVYICKDVLIKASCEPKSVPLTGMVSTFPFNTMRFVLDRYFGFARGESGDGGRWKRVAWLLALFMICLLATVVGPVVAILIIPRQEWFRIADLEFYFRAYGGQEAWLQRMDERAFNATECVGRDATLLEWCPAAGFSSIMAWSTTLGKSDVRNDDAAIGNPLFKGTYINQVEARTQARRGAHSGASSVWQIPLGVADQFMYIEDQWTVASMKMTAYDKLRFRHWTGLKRRGMVKTRVPYTQTVCLARQNVTGGDTQLDFPWPDSDIYTVQWRPSRPGESRDLTKRFRMEISNSSEGIQHQWVQWAQWNRTQWDERGSPREAFTDPHVRIQWLPVEDSEQQHSTSNPSLRASARAVVYLPTDSERPSTQSPPGAGSSNTTARGAYACSVFSWYTPADIVFSIAVTPLLKHRPGNRVYTSTIDAHDFRSALAEESNILHGTPPPGRPHPDFIHLGPRWLHALTPPLLDSKTPMLTFERMAENALIGRADVYLTNDPAKEGIAVELLLGLVVNDGIARTGAGKWIMPLEYDPRLSPSDVGRTFLTGPNPIVDPCRNGSSGRYATEVSPSRNPNGTSTVTYSCNMGKARMILQAYGYGHVLGKTTVSCLVVVSFYIVIAIWHTVYITFYVHS